MYGRGWGAALGTTFERSVSGLFVDVFSFTPATVAGTVSVTLTPLDSSVQFFAALLADQGFGFLPESGATNFSFAAMVDAAKPLSLTVFGFAGNADTLADAAGRYSGNRCPDGGGRSRAGDVCALPRGTGSAERGRQAPQEDSRTGLKARRRFVLGSTRPAILKG